jgi:hypothetical protein
MFSTTGNYVPLNRQLKTALRYANATSYSGLKDTPLQTTSTIPPVSNANRKAFIKARLERNYKDLKSRIGSLSQEEVFRMRNLNKGIKNLSGGTRKNRKSRKASKKRSTRRR